MTLTWKSILALVFVVVALFLLAAVPAVEASEHPGFSPVDEPTELIADSSAMTNSEISRSQRLSESPGGAVAKVTNSVKVTDNAKEVLPGGAAGVAGIGIRGPTLA